MIARGDGLVTRKLDRSLLRSVARTGAALSLRLSDFTLPAARLEFADDATAATWQTRLRVS